ncbi:hypothetical protein [Streptomonospora arabica]|uniref:Uncharacterized protein n=1 Tax=Streptomonospora arabica TaxID=412417 RepID=A0ABV9SJ69_9ACTN
MSVLRRITEYLLRLDGADPAERFPVDTERDANRLRAIVARERAGGELIIRPGEIWQEMSDDLFGPEHRHIGTDRGGLAQREWIYARMQELVAEGRLVEDADHGGIHGQFWHTSTPVARMINASTQFRVAMELTEDQLRAEGHQELLDVLTRGVQAMDEVKTVAKHYSQTHRVHRRGETSGHFLHLDPDTHEPHCICGWSGGAHDDADAAVDAWRTHAPAAR